MHWDCVLANIMWCFNNENSSVRTISISGGHSQGAKRGWGIGSRKSVRSCSGRGCLFRCCASRFFVIGQDSAMLKPETSFERTVASCMFQVASIRTAARLRTRTRWSLLKTTLSVKGPERGRWTLKSGEPAERCLEPSSLKSNPRTFFLAFALITCNLQHCTCKYSRFSPRGSRFWPGPLSEWRKARKDCHPRRTFP